jgi:hypothetical protein
MLAFLLELKSVLSGGNPTFCIRFIKKLAIIVVFVVVVIIGRNAQQASRVVILRVFSQEAQGDLLDDFVQPVLRLRQRERQQPHMERAEQLEEARAPDQHHPVYGGRELVLLAPEKRLRKSSLPPRVHASRASSARYRVHGGNRSPRGFDTVPVHDQQRHHAAAALSAILPSRLSEE